MTVKREVVRPGILFTTMALALSAAAWAEQPKAEGILRLPLTVEKLAPPTGATLPSWDTLELVPAGPGRYDVRLLPGENAPRLADADLSLLVPRAPRIAAGNDALTRLALIQREYNRNEVHNPLPDGSDLSIANNCLERGLWEVKVARTNEGKTVTLFHAWFTFPAPEYARLFRVANGGLEYASFDRLFASYPGLGGLALPLDALRRVISERDLAGLQTHSSEPLDRLTEQTGKVKLLRTNGIETYAGFTRPDKQPIALAKFDAPGKYDSAETMRFDLSWLAHPASIVWRQVQSPRVPGTFPEIEVRFENGYRILAADADLSRLVARPQSPRTEADVLRLVCGIGTPVIHATASERAAELSQDRPRYLMILDAEGRHVDNHTTGVDGLYAWRGAGDQLHLWLLSYERIAFVAHLSARWPGGV